MHVIHILFLLLYRTHKSIQQIFNVKLKLIAGWRRRECFCRATCEQRRPSQHAVAQERLEIGLGERIDARADDVGRHVSFVRALADHVLEHSESTLEVHEHRALELVLRTSKLFVGDALHDAHQLVHKQRHNLASTGVLGRSKNAKEAGVVVRVIESNTSIERATKK